MSALRGLEHIAALLSEAVHPLQDKRGQLLQATPTAILHLPDGPRAAQPTHQGRITHHQQGLHTAQAPAPAPAPEPEATHQVPARVATHQDPAQEAIRQVLLHRVPLQGLHPAAAHLPGVEDRGN
jgi:hypothetical protein